MNSEIKFEYGFESVNGIVKKVYHLHDIPNIKEKCDVWNMLPIKYVRRFTGLLDKSGKEVFEGDLFQVANNHIYQVKYLHGVSNHELYCGMFGLWLNEETFFPFDEYAMKHGEIIGNLYETELTNK